MCYIFLDGEGNPLDFEHCNQNEIAVIRDSDTGLDWEVKSLDVENFRYCQRPLNWFDFNEKYIPLAYRLVRNLDAANKKFQIPAGGQTEIFSANGEVINVNPMLAKHSSAKLKHCLIDFQTGLHYEKSEPQKKFTFEEAVKHVEELNANFYDGKNTWRLPTVDELRFIVDYSKKSPAVFEHFAPYVDSDFYWTSESIMDGARAWTIFFGYGCAVPIDTSQLCGCIAVS